jgi:uncharacterized protein with NRDE domain
VLTNFREEGADVNPADVHGMRSRGAIVKGWLTGEHGDQAGEKTEDYARRLVEEGSIGGVGGFSCVYGYVWDVVKGQKGLAVVSNRTTTTESGLVWLAKGRGETHALSNSHYGDGSWPKVSEAEKAIADAIRRSVSQNEGKEELLDRLFDVLSIDTLPRRKNEEEWETYLHQLRNSIFIPPVGDSNQMQGKRNDEIAAANSNAVLDVSTGIYGTQKQSVILCDQEGNLTFVERTLFDGDARPIEKGKGDRRVEFRIEGW